MIKENSQPKRLREIKIKPETLCSIWIMNHEGVLRERYKFYLKCSKAIFYFDKKGEMVYSEPDMAFEEYAVFIYDNAAFAIEHNLN